jgi:hypothetical protein
MLARSRFSVWTVAALGVSLYMISTACTASTNLYDAPHPTAGERSITVAVANRCIDNARVFLFHGSTPVHLGTVGGMESRRFKVSRARLGNSPVLFMAVEISGSRESIALAPVEVQPGETVDLLIATTLQNSLVARRP